MLLIHKCIYFASELPIVFQNRLDFNKDFHSHDTRTKNSVHLHCANSVGKLCLNFRGGQYWNTLPIEIRKHCSTSLFKKIILAYLTKNELI